MTREEAIEIINCYDIGFYDLSGKKIPADKLAEAFDMAIEALQAEPVKHGEWEDRISCQVDEDAYHVANCSECKAEITIDPNYDSYCPNCGAYMRGDKE